MKEYSLSKKRIFNKEEIKDIVSRYKNGESVMSICRKHETYKKLINKILKEAGTSKIRKKGWKFERPEKQKIPKEYFLKLKKKYEAGKSLYDLSKEYKVSHSTVANFFKKNNFKLRDCSHRYRIYEINEYYFNKIDTQEKAYFLGFLYADGNVSKKKNIIRLTLHNRDKDILLKLMSFICPNRSLLKRKDEDQSILMLTNLRIKEDLIKHGCVPCKSAILEYPNFLSSELENHFIRGYFDGDGCFYYGERKDRESKRSCVSICGSESFCVGLRSIIIKEKIKSHVVNNGNIKVLNLSGSHNVIKFMDFIYKDATIYLQRKYKKYCEFRREYHNNILKSDKHHPYNKKWYKEYSKTSSFSLPPLKN